MSFTSLQLLQRLSALQADDPPPRYLVAFSGGLDSTVLLHAMCQPGSEIAAPVIAVHVNHGLHPDAKSWEERCRDVAAEMGVAFNSVSVSVSEDTGKGLEAAAREVRYQALQHHMQAGDWLLSAHHQDDQAETLLLNLLRGSGMAGMAGIGEKQRLGDGFLLRPLLKVTRQDLQDYAKDNDLRWLDDPSNTETRFDRNFLRHEILPALAGRWPAAAARLAASSVLASEASVLLEELADDDLRSVSTATEPGRIDISRLTTLSDPRQRNLLRLALKRMNLPAPPATRLRQILDELISARADAEPLVHWPGVEIRRYRDTLFLLPEQSLPDAVTSVLDVDQRSVDLGNLGCLRLVANKKPGIRAELLKAGLEVRFRMGGEEICPVDHRCTHKLKKLLQQESVLPWMRDRIPLLYGGGRLVAVADIWVAADAADNDGCGLEWSGHAPLR